MDKERRKILIGAASGALGYFASRFLPVDQNLVYAQAIEADEPEITPEPTVQPEETGKEINILEILMPVLVAERDRSRENLKPNILRGVDKELNSKRINFVIFGYGETHEPPTTEHAWIGSLSVFSLNLVKGEIDIVSITHDTRAREAELFLNNSGRPINRAVRMGEVYQIGGLDLIKEVAVNSTGLSPDFVMYLPDSAIADLIDKVPQKIKVDVVKEFSVNGYYFKNVKHPEIRTYPAGVSELNGEEVIQFIKTVPAEGLGQYDKSLEHNVRKALVIKGLFASLTEQTGELAFWLRLGKYLGRDIKSEQGVEYDFEPAVLFRDNIIKIVAELAKAKLNGQKVNTTMPQLAKALYIVDEKSGNGGVRWAEGDPNPITVRDRARGVYPDINMEVPIGGNPYSDNLPRDYWASTRRLVADRFK